MYVRVKLRNKPKSQIATDIPVKATRTFKNPAEKAGLGSGHIRECAFFSRFTHMFFNPSKVRMKIPKRLLDAAGLGA